MAVLLAAHGTPQPVIDTELQQMVEVRLAKAANRSIVEITNEFSHLAEAWRQDEPALDLPQLALRLAPTPCAPLYECHISPDRELAALMIGAKTHPPH